MIRDHRPYWVKRAYLGFQKFYVRQFLAPHFESLGSHFIFMKPWHVEVFGGPVALGNCVHVIAAPDQKVRLSVWAETAGKGRIEIGNYCLVCPGVRVGSAERITIGDNCMIASNVYITDSDWHGLYDRVAAGRTAAVNIEENVWIGDSAIICKGVTIGENCIVGAGAVVATSLPPNSVAAGNPAKVINTLNPEEKLTKRHQWFSNPDRLTTDIDQLDRQMLKENSLLHWIRNLAAPKKGE
jgi:acetyltransferase-like isoleucine patch superfamily enzyme